MSLPHPPAHQVQCSGTISRAEHLPDVLEQSARESHGIVGLSMGAEMGNNNTSSLRGAEKEDSDYESKGRSPDNNHGTHDPQDLEARAVGSKNGDQKETGLINGDHLNSGVENVTSGGREQEENGPPEDPSKAGKPLEEVPVDGFQSHEHISVSGDNPLVQEDDEDTTKVILDTLSASNNREYQEMVDIKSDQHENPESAKGQSDEDISDSTLTREVEECQVENIDPLGSSDSGVLSRKDAQSEKETFEKSMTESESEDRLLAVEERFDIEGRNDSSDGLGIFCNRDSSEAEDEDTLVAREADTVDRSENGESSGKIILDVDDLKTRYNKEQVAEGRREVDMPDNKVPLKSLRGDARNEPETGENADYNDVHTNFGQIEHKQREVSQVIFGGKHVTSPQMEEEEDMVEKNIPETEKRVECAARKKSNRTNGLCRSQSLPVRQAQINLASCVPPVLTSRGSLPEQDHIKECSTFARGTEVLRESSSVEASSKESAERETSAPPALGFSSGKSPNNGLDYVQMPSEIQTETRIMAYRPVLTVMGNGKYESTPRLGTASHLDSLHHHSQMQKSPSFGNDLRIEARTEERDRITRNGSPEAMGVEEKVVILDDGEGSSDLGEKQAASSGSLKGREKRRARSSLFGTCLCCASVIN